MENKNPNRFLLLSTPAEAVAKFKKQIAKEHSHCDRLELEVHSSDLELHKLKEKITHLERVIYLFSAITPDCVTSIAKELETVVGLRETNLKLKKRLLFEKKTQFDYIEGKKSIESKGMLEREEMINEAEANLVQANSKMQESLRILINEKAELSKKTADAERKLSSCPAFKLYMKVYEELTQLECAQKTCLSLKDRQYSILSQSGAEVLKQSIPFRVPFSCLCGNNNHID